MLEFDAKTKTLKAYKNKHAVPDKEKMETLGKRNRESYQYYIHNQLENDIKEIFHPMLRTLIANDKAGHDLFVPLIDSVIIDETPDCDLAANNNNDLVFAKVRFYDKRFNTDPNKNKYINLIKLPIIDEEGVLRYEGKEYGFINMIEQQNTISYTEDKNGRSIKLKFPRATINITANANGLPIIECGRLKCSMINLIFAMAKHEGLNGKEIYDEFYNYRIRQEFTNESDLEQAIYFFGKSNNEEILTLATQLMGDYYIHDKLYTTYNANQLRDSLNKLCSLNNASGLILNEDVYSAISPGQVLAKKGDTITEALLTKFYSHKVYKLYVDSIPDIDGQVLMSDIKIHIINVGTKVTKDILSYLDPSEYNNMYVSKPHVFVSDDDLYNQIKDDNTKVIVDCRANPNLGIIPAGTVISRDLLQSLSTILFTSSDGFNIGYYLCAAVNGKKDKVVKYFFRTEYMSNRHFDSADGVSSSEEFYNGSYRNSSDYFTTYDMVALYSIAIKILNGKHQNIIPNIDTGFRKRAISVAEMYHRAFEYATEQTRKISKRKIKNMWENKQYEFYKTDSELENQMYIFQVNFFRYMSQEVRCLELLANSAITNPLQYLSSCTKANTYVANSNSVKDEQRRVAIGSYSKIDTYEIPQSGKMGVCSNFTTQVKIDDKGIMRAPYYRVRRGKVNFNSVEYLSIEEEEQCKIADISSLDIDDNGNILNIDDLVLARVHDDNSVDRSTFTYVKASEVNYVNINSATSVSWCSYNIPFLGCNDAARVVFGNAQAKQAKGLVKPDRPRVATFANEIIPWITNRYSFVAKDDGVVVNCSTLHKNLKDSNKPHSISVRYNNGEEIIYDFPEFVDSGDSVTVYEFNCYEGMEFKKGDVLVKSNFVDETGNLTLGKNKLIAYMPNGYNYEDGVFQSKNSAYDMFSYRVYSEKVEFKRSHAPFSRTVIHSGCNKITTPGTRVADIYFTDGSNKQFVATKARGFYLGNQILHENGQPRATGIKFKFLSMDKQILGDKMANRHGNKGVCSKIEENAFMPRFQNGVPIDVVYNPHGVTSRMNIGQIKECNLALAAYVLDFYVLADAFNPITNEEIERLLSYTVDIMNSDSLEQAKAISASYDLPQSLKDYVLGRYNKITVWRGCFDKNGEAYLINPKNNFQLTQTKVLVGVNYEYKLIQESAKKLHARAGMLSGEEYVRVSGGPTKGSTNHGGQKAGTMEMDALCAYGATNLINEILNYRGDNPAGRNNINVKTFLPESQQFNYLIEDTQRRSVTQFLYSMLAMGVKFEPTQGEFIPLSKDNQNLYAYKVGELQRAGIEVNENNYYKPAYQRGYDNLSSLFKPLEEDTHEEDLFDSFMNDMLAGTGIQFRNNSVPDTNIKEEESVPEIKEEDTVTDNGFDLKSSALETLAGFSED